MSVYDKYDTECQNSCDQLVRDLLSTNVSFMRVNSLPAQIQTQPDFRMLMGAKLLAHTLA